jgi:hypothetical protein
VWAVVAANASAAARAETFSSAHLDKLMAEQGVHTVSELVKVLPEFFQGNLTFVFESRSAQPARLVFHDSEGDHSGVTKPRALLWEPEGKFFLTYNGYPKALGFSTVETMEFVEAGAAPEFRFGGRIFPRDDAHAVAIETDKKCLGCHGGRARPIWPEYPRWEGVYGSKEDIIQSSEEENFKTFLSEARFDPLYRGLFPPNAWTNFPYKPDANVNVTAETHSFKYRPNTRMGILLNRLNVRRVFALLKLQSEFANDRPRLAYYFLGCDTSSGGWQLLMKYGLSAPDLDMRTTYYHDFYETLDFNDSYFDGASTANELLAAAVLKDLLESPDGKVGELEGAVQFNSLSKLYPSSVHRKNDAAFFAVADGLGEWIRTLFPEAQAKKKLRPRPTPSEADRVRELCVRLQSTF